MRSKGGNGSGSWEEVTDLLKAKTGLHEERLPRSIAQALPRYPLMQQPFYKHCDVYIHLGYLAGEM